MATYGREDEVGFFLNSILKQNYDISKVEILIIDQNDKIILDDIIKKYNQRLNIIHIKSDKKGLSLNRNIGLKIAKGKYIAFPDDDCIYYENTLSSCEKEFQKNKDIDVLLGKIYDKKAQKNIIRNWKNYIYEVNIHNFFLSYSSITIFIKKNNILFDENLGVGTFFGSYEDGDYILQLLENNKKLIYTPNISVWHPDLSANIMNNSKIYSYGLGFGGMVKKHLSLPIGLLFIKAIGFHFIKLLQSIFIFDFINMRKRYISIISRIKGFYLYEIK
jgi:glycosyltransferase involved in cell wall biosynthesis